jgi:ketose-bisphosphate aldolase
VKTTSNDLIHAAWKGGFVIPAFNIPYLPMMAPVVAALRETSTLGLIAVARLEWEKFESGSPEAVREEYEQVKDERFTRLHLDHVPVIDEDNLRVDFEEILSRAIGLGYDSVMVDGSRLPLEENIAATRRIVDLAHETGIPVEAELGAVMGHESGPLPPYEELFASGKGFTDPAELQRFVAESGVDWMSVAVGSIHGAISEAAKGQEKPAARLDLDHLEKLQTAAPIPFVLHGGTGIPKDYILGGIQRGIAKINIGHAIRTAHINALRAGGNAFDAVFHETVRILREDLNCAGSAKRNES